MKLTPFTSHRRNGFSLLEAAIVLGISGIMLGGVWQLMGSTNKTQNAKVLASQAAAVAIAAQDYINDRKSSILGVITSLAPTAPFNICIKITDSDASCGTATSTLPSLVGAGYLPAGFVNSNAYNQAYKFIVSRQDSGAAGADPDDRVLGLILTTGGATIDDKAGVQTAQAMGAAGGFVYSGGTTADGTAGGWQVTLNSDPWTATGAAEPGHIAVLTNLYPMVGNSAGGTVHALDDLSDARTNYGAVSNMFLGSGSGGSISSGINNTALGAIALSAVTTGNNNSAFGRSALYANTTGSDNTAIGVNALVTASTASQNTAVGSAALYGITTTGNANTAVGYQAGYGTTTGTNNTALGERALLNSTTFSNNVAVGSAALYNNGANWNVGIGTNALIGYNGIYTGSYNIAIGGGTMGYNTTGSYNTGIGGNANFGANTTGSYNVGIGNYALNANTTASNNVAVGVNALASNQTMGGNVAIGYGAMQYTNGAPGASLAIGTDALKNQTSAYNNLAIGNSAMLTNQIKTENVAIGHNAMLYTYTGGAADGTGNVAVGNYALQGSNLAANNSGKYNTAIGFSALTATTSGGNNVAVGYNAGLSTTTSSENVAIGWQALNANTTTCCNVAIGAGAMYNANGALTENVAIGRNSLYSGTTAYNNTAIGTGAMFYVQTGNSNVAIGSGAMAGTANNSSSTSVAVGYNALWRVNGANDNNALGWSAGSTITTGTNNFAFGRAALADSAGGSGGITTGSGNISMTDWPGGPSGNFDDTITMGRGARTNGSNAIAIGANSTAAANTIQIGNGQTIAAAPVAWTTPSDRRLKKDIEGTDLGLAFIEKLRPVRYRLIDGNGRLDYGFIAQELDEALGGRATNMVTQKNDEMKTYQVRHTDLIAPMVKAMQEQQAEIEALKAELAALKDEIRKSNASAGQ